MITPLIPAFVLSAIIPGVLFASAKKPSLACRSCNCLLDIAPGESVNLTLGHSKSGVATRRYRLHLPETYNHEDPVPVIFSYHGRTKDALNQEELSQFSNSSYGFEGISVYPEGIANDKGSQQFQGDPDAPSDIDDITFTLELLDHLESTYCIDTSRIYATGKSNGGGFTGLLACDAEATSRIAAFAPVSGAFYLQEDGKLPECKPSRQPVPLMELHGYKDTTIPYEGGLNNRGTANTTDIVTYVEDWVKRNDLNVNNKKTSTFCRGSKLVTRYSWDDVVVHYNYSNIYHNWMSSFPNPDTDTKLTCKNAEATPIILEWFKKWSL